MLTPIRVVVVAAALGIGTAIIISMQAPPLPAEDAVTPAVSTSAPVPSQNPPPSYVLGPTTQPQQQSSTFKLASGPVTKTASGLTIIDVRPGKGAQAEAGDIVQIHYIGRLYSDGTQFDSSYNRGPPMTVRLISGGDGGAIPGFVEGVIGMKVGEKRQLVIPGDLAYGPQGNPHAHIPPNATIVFDVELVSVAGKT